MLKQGGPEEQQGSEAELLDDSASHDPRADVVTGISELTD